VPTRYTNLPGADEIDRMICSDHYNDAAVVRFYDTENGWAEDFDFCSDLAKGRRAILDLGCGTGMLAAALARFGGRAMDGRRVRSAVVATRSRDHPAWQTSISEAIR
jgi:predicted RNA methylase